MTKDSLIIVIVRLTCSLVACMSLSTSFFCSRCSGKFQRKLESYAEIKFEEENEKEKLYSGEREKLKVVILFYASPDFPFGTSTDWKESLLRTHKKKKAEPCDTHVELLALPYARPKVPRCSIFPKSIPFKHALQP